jgi:hypothetical protein
MSLWDIAREVVDEVCGPGAYAQANRGNPDPLVQEQVAISDARGLPTSQRLFTERDVQSLVNYATGEQIGEHLDIGALIELTTNMGHPLDETMHGDLKDEWKVTHAPGWPDPVHFTDREKAITFHQEHGGLLWHRWVTEWTEA